MQRTTTRILCLAAAACLMAACGGNGPLVPRAPLPEAADANARAGGFAAFFASRLATVVDISTLRLARNDGVVEEDDVEPQLAPEIDFADRLAWPLPAGLSINQIRDLASGVILTSDGLILTSAHLVADVDEAQVRLHDGRRFTARVIGIDRPSDVALLKIDAAGLPIAVIGDSSGLAPGDAVAAISAPFGFSASVTTGVVSATDRFIPGAGEIPFVQTDVAINPGSSGSPLFNTKGEVVAINSMIYSGSGGYMGLSFAVPINLAMKVAAQLRTAGFVRRGYLGAQLQEVTPALAQSFALPRAAGALVARVDAAGPAQAAGLARGDVVTAIDGAGIAHFTELLNRIADREAGAPAELEVWRRGVRQTLRVSLGERPRGRRPAAIGATAAEWSDGLGLSLGEISAAQRRQLRVDAGLLVREAEGAARSEGIRAGDLIVALNDMPLQRVADFKQALSRLPPGRMVALLVMRDLRLAYVPVRLPERQRAPAASPN